MSILFSKWISLPLVSAAMIANLNMQWPYPLQGYVSPAKRSDVDMWLDYVMPRLSSWESNDQCDRVNHDDAKITGYDSIGLFQYQPLTFARYIKKYNLLPHAEESEYENFITDCQFQYNLTRLILRNEPDAWRNWYTTFMYLKLPKTALEWQKSSTSEK